MLIDYSQALGFPEGYLLFAALMITLQVPVAAAFLLTVSAGAIGRSPDGDRSPARRSRRRSPSGFGARPGASCAAVGARLAAVRRDRRRLRARELRRRATLITPFASRPSCRSRGPTTSSACRACRSPPSPRHLPRLLARRRRVRVGRHAGAEIVVNGSETSPWLLALGVAATLAAVASPAARERLQGGRSRPRGRLAAPRRRPRGVRRRKGGRGGVSW